MFLNKIFFSIFSKISFFNSFHMSRFRSSVGRFAFARGNSSWAREFNSNMDFLRRGFVTGPLSLNRTRLSASAMMALAGEVPTLTGFAEQFRGMSSLSGSVAIESSESVCDDEVLVSKVSAIDSVVASLTHGCTVSTKTWSLDGGLRRDEQRNMKM